MFNKNRKQKVRGQTLVEYALLLGVAIFAMTAYLQLDESLEIKIAQIARDLIDTEPGLPWEEGDPIETDRLYPPVADFTVPEPNYKGRDIKLVDRSYDMDGYVEHYIWTVDGVEMRQTKEEAERLNGMVVNFRYSGTYEVSLMVVDNDGLVSNKVTKLVKVENRNPFIELTAKSHTGSTATNGGTITVHQYCTAKFTTDYGDEDLPYEELELYSRFKDSTGVVSEYDTIPYEFERPFENAGMNEYFVKVTDEDGATATAKVNIRVVTNPDPNAMSQKKCTAAPPPPPPSTDKPSFKIEVEGYVRKDETKNPREYYFTPNTVATVRGVYTPGSNPEHAIGRYWSTTDFLNQGNAWNSQAKWGTIFRPSGGLQFTPTTPPISITGMARDNTATSTVPDSSLPGMSNKDSVILKVECPDPSTLKPGQVNPCAVEPTPVISVNDKAKTPPENKVLELAVGVKPTTDFNCNKTECQLSVNSRHSISNSGGEINGVRFEVGGTWFPRSKDPGANFGITQIEEKVNHKGETELWFTGKINSPDTISGIGRKFKIGDGEGPNKDKFTYKLRVIDSNNMSSTKPAEKVIWLKEQNTQPVAVCRVANSESKTLEVNVNEEFGAKINAKGSHDGNNGTSNLTITYSAQGKDGMDVNKTDILAPSGGTWKYSNPGEYKLTVTVTNKDGGAKATDTCTIKVKAKPQLAPMDLELWAIENRVHPKGTVIKPQNKTTPMEVVANDGVWFYYSTQPNAFFSSAKGWQQSDRTSKGVTMPGSSNFAGAAVVSLYTTNIEGKDYCTRTATAGKRVSKDPQNRKFCEKQAWYARTQAYSFDSDFNPMQGTKKRCTIQTIHAAFKTIQDFDSRWPRLKYEYDAGVDVRTAVKKGLEPPSCSTVPIGS